MNAKIISEIETSLSQEFTLRNLIFYTFNCFVSLNLLLSLPCWPINQLYSVTYTYVCMYLCIKIQHRNIFYMTYILYIMHIQFCLLGCKIFMSKSCLLYLLQLLTQQFSQSKVFSNYFLSVFKSIFHLTFQLLNSEISNNYN